MGGRGPSTYFFPILVGVKKCSKVDKVRDCKWLKTLVNLIDIIWYYSFPQGKKSEQKAKIRTWNQQLTEVIGADFGYWYY
jgi:hypothetical protein